jgi:signal transduction histidine kinase
VRELREIASEFSTYARLPDLQRVPTDLGTVLHATIAPYAEMAPAGVEVRTRFAPIPPVLVDPRVLNRAFVNLIENALQAMDGGGVLSVALHRAEGPEGDRAEIVFEDTGEGMDEATRARIFEPYFSTRDTGTVLGLAIAKRAVEEHGGTMTVESTPGRGTRMIVRLPLEAEGPGSPGQSAGEAGVRARPAPSS